ncbi:hypothetical protein BRC81_10685 [Halobacteriales archaeon QS_1_68_20]|nr:MAG: hypothetical protein BRC81_10685 [Halobacteriales archaeon QS_1_68_20]
MNETTKRVVVLATVAVLLVGATGAASAVWDTPSDEDQSDDVEAADGLLPTSTDDPAVDGEYRTYEHTGGENPYSYGEIV